MSSTKILTTVLTIGFILSFNAAAEDGKSFVKEVHDQIKVYLKGKTIQSGTFDIYDSDADKVRNLRVIEFSDDVTYTAPEYMANLKFRDTASGDIVSLKFILEETDGPLAVRKYSIEGVEKIKKQASKSKEVSDDEVRMVMKSYVEKLSKFTGSMSVFDPDKQAMRNLELIEFQESIRKFGVLNISRANFKDVDSGEMVEVDITVQNKDDQLKVKTVRIFSVK